VVWKGIKQLKIRISIVCLRSSAHKLFVDLPLTKVGEHKSRVLSEVTVAADDTALKADEVIEQVTTLEAQDGGLVKGAGVSDEQEKNIGSQQQSSSEVGIYNFS
jgi:alpha-1,4-galacturonosyltransferase